MVGCCALDHLDQRRPGALLSDDFGLGVERNEGRLGYDACFERGPRRALDGPRDVIGCRGTVEGRGAAITPDSPLRSVLAPA
jgi:hypothetical protein